MPKPVIDVAAIRRALEENKMPGRDGPLTREERERLKALAFGAIHGRTPAIMIQDSVFVAEPEG